MGTQTVTNMEFRSGKMSTGTMTSPNTGKPQAVVAPAIVIQQTENSSPTYQMKPRNQTTVSEPLRTQVPTLSRTALYVLKSLYNWEPMKVLETDYFLFQILVLSSKCEQIRQELRCLTLKLPFSAKAMLVRG